MKRSLFPARYFVATAVADYAKDAGLSRGIPIIATLSTPHPRRGAGKWDFVTARRRISSSTLASSVTNREKEAAIFITDYYIES